MEIYMYVAIYSYYENRSPPVDFLCQVFVLCLSTHLYWKIIVLLKPVMFYTELHTCTSIWIRIIIPAVCSSLV